MTDGNGCSVHNTSSMSLVGETDGTNAKYGSMRWFIRIVKGLLQNEILPSCLLFLFHVLQTCGGSVWICEKFTSYGQRIFRITSDFLGVVIELFGLEYVNTNSFVLFVRAALSNCLFLGIFSFHLSVKVTERLILSMLVFLPLCIASGCLLDHKGDYPWISSWSRSIGLAVTVISFVVIAVYRLKVNAREYIQTKIFNPLMYPIQKMFKYCSCGTREAENVSDTLPNCLLLVNICITWAIFPMFVRCIYVHCIISVCLTAVPISLTILRCKLNLNGIHDVLTKFVWDVNYLHRDLVQLFAVGQLGKYLRDSDNRSWSLGICVVSCYVISPLLHLALTTHECRKLSHRLGDNSTDYPKTIANSGAVFAHLCGIKQNCYWWPLLEFIVKNTYTVFSALDTDDWIYIWLIWILFVVYISVRPHQKYYVVIFNSFELLFIALTDISRVFLRNAAPDLSSTILKCIVLVIPSLAVIGVFTLQSRMNMTRRTGAEPDQSDNESQGGEQNNRNTIIGERVTRVIYACQLPIALLSFMACVIDWFHLFDAVSIT